jgi:hypothetical protein
MNNQAPEQETYEAPAVQAPAPRQQQRVSPVSRFAPQAAAAPRTLSQVRLTKSEVSIARKLGLSPEQYAEQKMKDYPNG